MDAHGHSNGLGRAGKVHAAREAKAKQLCTGVKLLTDAQILGCELHRNAFGGRAPPGPAGGAIAVPRLPSRYKGKGGREREGRGSEWGGGKRENKGRA